MANRYANLVGSNKIKDEYQKINIGFDKVEQEMDEKPDNSFAKINDVEAEGEDAVTIEAGTGITVTTTPEEKKIRITATGEAAPGPHGSEHNHDGADPIPDLVQLRELGLGIDVDPRISSDLNNEINTGWVRFESDETANTPGEQIDSFPHSGVVRVDRRNNSRLVQTAYGVAGATDVRIAVRALGSAGWGDWVEMLHTGNASPGVIGAVSRTGDTMTGDLTINKSVPLLELIHEATGTSVAGGLIMRNVEQDVWRVGAASGSGHFIIESFIRNINLRSASYRYGLHGPSGDVSIVVHDAHPEGSVSAAVGTICLRTDSGSHAKLYVKNSGTGNTGWVEVLTS